MHSESTTNAIQFLAPLTFWIQNYTCPTVLCVTNLVILGSIITDLSYRRTLWGKLYRQRAYMGRTYRPLRVPINITISTFWKEWITNTVQNARNCIQVHSNVFQKHPSRGITTQQKVTEKRGKGQGLHICTKHGPNPMTGSSYTSCMQIMTIRLT